MIDCLIILVSLFCFSLSHARPFNNTHIYQFGAVENGITVTKLMQIFSRQAAMMDALISHFTDLMRRRKDGMDVADNASDDGESDTSLIALFYLFRCFVPRPVTCCARNSLG